MPKTPASRCSTPHPARRPRAAEDEFGIWAGEWANDADYYFTIARSVAEGEGLKSNLSLYYQGFKELPHFVTGSPVWPLFLGSIGAVIGMETAALWVPNALYMTSLVLLYLLGVRLTRAISAPAGENGSAPQAAAAAGGWLFREDAVVNLGHVAVLLFASNAVYFQFSSVPNNEPLAFCLVFGALLALERAARGHAIGWALLAGALAGLAVLTRFRRWRWRSRYRSRSRCWRFGQGRTQARTPRRSWRHCCPSSPGSCT